MSNSLALLSAWDDFDWKVAVGIARTRQDYVVMMASYAVVVASCCWNAAVMSWEICCGRWVLLGRVQQFNTIGPFFGGGAGVFLGVFSVGALGSLIWPSGHLFEIEM